MTVHIKRSTDAGLAGIPMNGSTAGRFIAILDAILQDGYNSLSGVTVTRSGTTATYTKTGHGFTTQKGQIVKVGGFNETDYNITGPIFNVTANTWDMTVANSPATPGTGAGTAQHAPIFGAGSKIFSGTNLASYQALTGNRLVLGVDDALGTAQNARIRGFESMTAAGVAVGSGTNPFPTDAQQSGGAYFYRSSTNDTTARAWICVSDGKILYFFNQFSGVTTSGNGFIFGDFYSRKGSDAYAVLLKADVAASATSTSVRVSNNASTWAVNTGLWIARAYTGTAGSIQALNFGDNMRNAGQSEWGGAPVNYPNAIEGGLTMQPSWLGEATPANTARGTLPGIWPPCHQRPIAHGDTFSGAAGTMFSGKTFEAFNLGSNAQVIFETSDTWTAPS